MKQMLTLKCCLMLTGLLACSPLLMAQSKPAGPPEAPLPKFLNTTKAIKKPQPAEPVKVPSQGVPQNKPLRMDELKKKLRQLPSPKKP